MVVRTMLLYGSCSVSDTPDVWQCVRSMSDVGFLASNCLMARAHSRRGGAELGHLHEEVHADPEEEGQARRKVVDVEPALDGGVGVLDAVGQREAELLHRGRARFLHVVAGDRDRVEPRHLARRVLDDVGDDPQARRRRVDVGVADHELFEDVVLERSGELLLGTPCSSAATM